MTGFTPDAPVLHEIKNHSEELTKAEAGVAAFAAKRNNRWYPKFHIASNGGWINDPNGLCFYKGRWHVFYQLHPYGTQWGPMHWGHVSSADMVNWKREPIMFAPSLEEEKDGVFSGSFSPAVQPPSAISASMARTIAKHTAFFMVTSKSK